MGKGRKRGRGGMEGLKNPKPPGRNTTQPHKIERKKQSPSQKGKGHLSIQWGKGERIRTSKGKIYKNGGIAGRRR